MDVGEAGSQAASASLRPALPRSPALGLLSGGVALILAIVLTRTVTSPALGLQGAPAIWAGFVGVWVPLLAGVAVGAPWLLPGRSRAVLPPIPAPVLMRDIAWGIGAGLLVRLIATALSVLLTGSTGIAAQPMLSGPPSVAVLVAMALPPVVLAPVIEELFFRGLVQGAAARLLFGLSDSRALASWTAALGTAGLFAVVHLVVAPGSIPVLTLLGTFLLGLAAGVLALRTGFGLGVRGGALEFPLRAALAGPVAAHVVFNLLGVGATWPV